MSFRKILIANRGEIAIRIARACAELGIRSVAVAPDDDAGALHTRKADEQVRLSGVGAAAYLDIAQMIEVARAHGCDAVHPGYGFLSESATFARACEQAGLVFIGPAPEALELFGDKGQARDLAMRCGVQVMPGTQGPTTLAQARDFLASLGAGGALMVKAIAGGGGRGMRMVHAESELAPAFERCQSEALKSFGNGDVYVEELFPLARHIEVQIVGDREGGITHLWERDCSLQRGRQKIVEIAPAPSLHPGLRARLLEASLAMATEARYRSLGTFEFLVDAARSHDHADARFVFIEANPRLQVEHTITEEITGVDLVATQIRLAAGERLADVGLASVPVPEGVAIQLRVNMETLQADGSVRPAGGRLERYDPPSGLGVRVDGFGYAGYVTSPRYDSLLAKLIVHARTDDFEVAARRAARSAAEFSIVGVPTNLPMLRSLLSLVDLNAGAFDTLHVERQAAEIVAAIDATVLHMPHEAVAQAPAGHAGGRGASNPATGATAGTARPALDASDPLAVLHLGRQTARALDSGLDVEAGQGDGEGGLDVDAPLQGTIVAVSVTPGEQVTAGQALLVIESMKMEHVISAPATGTVARLEVAAGDTVFENQRLLQLETAEGADTVAQEAEAIDLDAIRPDLAEVRERQAFTHDAARPEAVAKRHSAGLRTARENIEDLCDPDSFVEYGSLVFAARRARNTIDELIRRTPADGLVMGLGHVNGEHFGETESRIVAMSYDYTVLAGTQGKKNHLKKDRMFTIAQQWKLPIVIFTEGGGGRPGDTDQIFAANLHGPAFAMFARLSGLVPLIGIASGRCFAGNAVLLGCCDVVIATRNSTIGMGGPAMIEGGGLGVFHPDEVGPIGAQTKSGVVDIAVEDEAEAVQAAKQYLSYFQGPIATWTAPDQRALRQMIPENRLRAYDVRKVIHGLADEGSVLELRRHFGPAMITAFARIEGRPIGIFANNPMHLGGAIDSDAADKVARFMQLCDAFDIPLLSLCDTPGNMVGPEFEKTALVRHCCRPFVIGANLKVPLFVVVLRKAYGLGAQGMAGGGFHEPFFAVSWPTGEFGGMGLEGAVKLGYRNELAAIEDPVERKAAFDKRVAGMYEQGKALSAAALFELDDVIDPADTRRWILAGLKALPPKLPREGKKHAWVDTW